MTPVFMILTHILLGKLLKFFAKVSILLRYSSATRTGLLLAGAKRPIVMSLIDIYLLLAVQYKADLLILVLLLPFTDRYGIACDRQNW